MRESERMKEVISKWAKYFGHLVVVQFKGEPVYLYEHNGSDEVVLPAMNKHGAPIIENGNMKAIRSLGLAPERDEKEGLVASYVIYGILAPAADGQMLSVARETKNGSGCVIVFNPDAILSLTVAVAPAGSRTAPEESRIVMPGGPN